MKWSSLLLLHLVDCDIRPDKYIRSIIKTSDGSIWSGGYYNLKQIDFNRKNIRAYPGLSGITDIKEKDAQHMWIGTATGLYLLDKDRQVSVHIDADRVFLH